MDLSILQPLPPQSAFRISRPVKVGHFGQDNRHVRNYEVWATKEAVQKHFDGMTGEPKEYQLRKFARRTYEDRLRVSNHQPAEKGVLVSTTQKIHGDPVQWPHSITDPEVKV